METIVIVVGVVGFVIGGLVGGAAVVIGIRSGFRALLRPVGLLAASGLIAFGAERLLGGVAPTVILIASVFAACLLIAAFVSLVWRGYHLIRSGSQSGAPPDVLARE